MLDALASSVASSVYTEITFERGIMNNRPTLNQVHEYLIDLVRQRKNPITYAQLAQHFDLDVAAETDTEFWTGLLGEISTTEHGRGNPLLSVMVIDSTVSRPGNDFFDLARNLGVYAGHSEIEHRKYFRREVKAVRDHWADTD